MGKDYPLFLLFEFCDTKNLGIGTIESITIPRNFQAKSERDKLKFLDKARNEKTEVGMSWPSEDCELSSRPKRGSSTSKEKDSTTTLKAIIRNFSEDKKIIEEIQTQIINKKKPRAKPAVTNSYRSNAFAGKSQAEAPKVLSRKDINVASKTIVQEHLPNNNATNHKDYDNENYDDDLGVHPLSPEATNVSHHSSCESDDSDIVESSSEDEKKKSEKRKLNRQPL